MHRLRSLSPAPLALAVIAMVFAVAGTATAAKLIGSKQIRNNSIRSIDVRNNSLTGKDIKDGSIKLRDLAPNARPKQPPTTEEPPAEQGNPHWGVIARNTIGSPVAELRTGPFVTTPGGDAVAPPFGEGSLGLAVAAGSTQESKEKVAFGNEVDFAGEDFLGISDLGFHVFTTGENFAAGEPMPVIYIELDPNLEEAGDDYTTAVWVPDDVAEEHLNTWSPYIDATSSGKWFLTGAEGTATGCSSSCSWEELTAALDDGGDAPVALTLAVGKGRDTAFVGAVDGLRVNDTLYDFEPNGVLERPIED